ncbi:DUF6624 domain-containing protein [Micromonospora sp. CPCC 205539]|uniref:DUF6624 domain-containing protein n=1 Tax=Micromonospora sp. CPCC 205539 TaxID=3122408 RepID=UPI002FEF5DD2
MKVVPRVLSALAVLAALAACDLPPEPTDDPPPSTPAASTSAPPTTPSRPAPSPARFNKALHDELVAMLKRDQADREGKPQSESDQARTARLKEIIRTYGWPTLSLVGKDGEDAAWAIAQHSDLDPAFQQEALELLRAAVAARQASPGNLAYLEDRVAAGKGEPQVYGTQVRCGPDGPVLATPIKDESGVEQRRAQAGLPTLASYLAELTAICAEDGN